MDKLIDLGEDILNEVADIPSPLKEDLNEIKEMWKKICSLSVAKQERLSKALKVVLECEKILWLRYYSLFFFVTGFSTISTKRASAMVLDGAERSRN